MHDPRPSQTPLAGVSLVEWMRALRAAKFRVRAGCRVMPKSARLKDFISRTLRIKYARWCRICRGIESPDDALVDRIGRIHVESFRSAVRIVGQRHGFAWSIDTRFYVK